RHFLQAFATLGLSCNIKTDNGPAYTSKIFQLFFQRWGIAHISGIAHSPTSQGIIEWTHQT
ncbi:PO113 protein, partial [Pteruthius melanotis]|nr:PO113 protein [Pteruthius melanotis]